MHQRSCPVALRHFVVLHSVDVQRTAPVDHCVRQEPLDPTLPPEGPHAGAVFGIATMVDEHDPDVALALGELREADDVLAGSLEGQAVYRFVVRTNITDVEEHLVEPGIEEGTSPLLVEQRAIRRHRADDPASRTFLTKHAASRFNNGSPRPHRLTFTRARESAERCSPRSNRYTIAWRNDWSKTSGDMSPSCGVRSLGQNPHRALQRFVISMSIVIPLLRQHPPRARRFLTLRGTSHETCRGHRHHLSLAQRPSLWSPSCASVNRNVTVPEGIDTACHRQTLRVRHRAALGRSFRVVRPGLLE